MVPIAVAAAAVVVAGIVVAGGVLASGGIGVSQSARPTPDPATENEARIACGTACHRFPAPDVLPRSAWRDELVRMQLIMDGVPEPAGSLSRAAVMIPLPPDMLRLLRYYEANAPEALAPPQTWPAPKASPVAFTQTSTRMAGMEGAGAFAIANVQFLDLDADNRAELVATDMRAGLVLAGPPDGPLTPIAEIPHPSRVHQVDLDKDGDADLLVSDLGSFQPADHKNGGLAWLRRDADGRYTVVRLASGLGRVADARAADFDGDGDLDIVAAVFGWRQTGSIILFENQTKDWASTVFVPRVLDARTGAIDVPIVDLDGNGTPDIVALLAQEHETVVALLNDGRGQFRTETVFAAPHPNWGSSGIEVVDFHRDGRLDVLLTHGDTFDDFLLKPYHGVTLLTNAGRYPFEPRTIADLPGAHRAVAIDVDDDGDLDVVAAAMVAGGGGALQDTLPAVVWLERRPDGTFARHSLALGNPFHATLAVTRNPEGRLSIAAGAFAFGKPMDAPVYLWRTSK